MAPVDSLLPLCGSRNETQAAGTTRQALSQRRHLALFLFDVTLFNLVFRDNGVSCSPG